MITSNYSLNLPSYTIKNALLWGNFKGHCLRAQEGSLGNRIVHVLIAAAELLPVISQIASLFEMLIACNTPRNIHIPNVQAAPIQLPRPIVPVNNPALLTDLSLEQVQKKLPDLSENDLLHISDEYLPQLNLRDLPAAKCRAIFNNRDLNENKRRFALLTASQVQQILPKLNPHQYLFLSDSQLQKLDFISLFSSQLKHLFSYKLRNENKRRFALLTAPQVQQILPKLGEELHKFISDAQLPQLDLARFSQLQLEQLFPFDLYFPELLRVSELFALLTASQVQQILPALRHEQYDFISDAQLLQLDLARFSQLQLKRFFSWSSAPQTWDEIRQNERNKKRFALLTASQVQQILPKLGDKVLFISNAQLPQLDFSLLSHLQLKELFTFDHFNLAETRRRFALLTAPQVLQILPNLDDPHFQLISTKQLPHLNLDQFPTKISESLFQGYNKSEYLFQGYNKAEIRERFACLTGGQIVNLIPNIPMTNVNFYQRLAKQILARDFLNTVPQDGTRRLIPDLTEIVTSYI